MKEEIVKRAYEILKETSSEQENYEEIRKIIFTLEQDLNANNIDILAKMENLYNKIRILEQESNNYKKIKLILNDLNEQRIRKADGSKTVHLFSLTDKNKQKYSFFTRVSAKAYFENNKDRFDENVEIEIDQSKNIDLEKLINIIT